MFVVKCDPNQRKGEGNANAREKLRKKAEVIQGAKHLIRKSSLKLRGSTLLHGMILELHQVDLFLTGNSEPHL